MRFDKKVALVTGASSGVGRSIAVRLASEGATLVLAGRRADALEDTAAAVEQFGVESLTVQADVCSFSDVKRMVTEAEQAFGGLDLVVHAAGVFRGGSLDEVAPTEWDHVIATNLTSCYLIGHHAVPALVRQGGGAMLMISSVASLRSDAGAAAYSASKAGMNALTRVMALDHAADGIRVNAIAPGNLRTEMLANHADTHYPDDPQAMLDAAGARHPHGRLIEAEEVASLAAFLLSSEATSISGSIYPIDGGWLGKLSGA